VTASALVADLRRRGVTLEPRGDRLRYCAPAGVLTDADREALRRHKAQVVALLRAAPSEPAGGNTPAPLGLDGTPDHRRGPDRRGGKSARGVPGWRVVVERCAPVAGPVILNGWTTVRDPARCIETDLATLARVVAARNAGREHYGFEALLADTLARLAACGAAVRVEAVQ
jgi:hypothetical protein